MRIFRLSWLFLWLVLTVLGAGSFDAAAQGSSPAPVTLTPRNLLDGYCRYNAVLPLAVTLENQGELVKGLLVALTNSGVGDLRQAYAAEVTLPALGRKVLMLYPNLPSYVNSITVQLQVRGRVIVEQTLPLSCVADGDWLVGVMSANGVSDFEVLRNAMPLMGSTFVAALPSDLLPETGLALGALDALVLSGVDTVSWKAEQREALKNWVAQGGTLIVTGAAFQVSAAGLTEMLPLTPQNSLTLRDLDALQMFDEQSVLNDDTPTPVVSGSLNAFGEVVTQQGQIPLITRRSLGWGQVFFLGFDPALAPLRTWNGMPKLYQALLMARNDAPGWNKGTMQADYANQAIRMVNSLQTFGLFLLCSLVGIYLLAAGPLNFLVLRMQKRSELAWLSVPLLAIGFSVLTGLVGTQLRGNRPQLQQLTLAQVSTTGEARFDALVGVFSPRRTTQTLRLPKHTLAVDLDAAFFGSLDWNLTHLERGENEVSFQMNSADFRSFAVSAEGVQAALKSNITSQLYSGLVHLVGSIENTSGINLKDVALLMPGSNGVYLGNFDAGEIKTIDTTITLSERAIPAPNPTINSPYYYIHDDTIDLLMGQSSSSVLVEDLDWQRRQKFLEAILYDDNDDYKGRDSGVYLSGWSEDANPIPIESQPAAQNNNTTLYIFELTLQLTPASSRLTLPPGMFFGSPIVDKANTNNSPYNNTPYNMYLAQNTTLTLRFEPIFPHLFANGRVEELIFQVESYGETGAAPFSAALWNFETSQWDTINNLNWGENNIANPQTYVSPAGEIRVQMQTNATSSYSIDIGSADFSVTLTNLSSGAP